MGVIHEFGFRPFASFSDAFTARLKSEKSATKSFPFLLLTGQVFPIYTDKEFDFGLDGIFHY